MRTIDQHDVTGRGERAAGLEDEFRIRIAAAIQRQRTCYTDAARRAVDTSRLGRTASPDDDGSSVLLIWYQDKFGLPVDAHILKYIAELDWDLYAHHWGY